DQARTRSVLRQVISLNRYARSRAILDKTSMAVDYDVEAGTVTLRALGRPPAGTVDGTEGEVVTERTLPHTMRLGKVEGAEAYDGRFRVRIPPEGVSVAHEVEIVDPRGSSRRIRFNGF